MAVVSAPCDYMSLSVSRRNRPTAADLSLVLDTWSEQPLSYSPCAPSPGGYSDCSSSSFSSSSPVTPLSGPSATLPPDVCSDSEDSWNLIPYNIPWGPEYYNYQMGTLPGPDGTCVFLRSPTPVKNKRTAKACNKCRERKAKCSGSHPTCTRCLSRGYICRYEPDDAKRSRGPSLARQRLRDTTPSPTRSSPPATPRHAPTPAHDPGAASGSRPSPFAHADAAPARGGSDLSAVLSDAQVTDYFTHACGPDPRMPPFCATFGQTTAAHLPLPAHDPFEAVDAAWGAPMGMFAPSVHAPQPVRCERGVSFLEGGAPCGVPVPCPPEHAAHAFASPAASPYEFEPAPYASDAVLSLAEGDVSYDYSPPATAYLPAFGMADMDSQYYCYDPALYGQDVGIEPHSTFIMA